MTNEVALRGRIAALVIAAMLSVAGAMSVAATVYADDAQAQKSDEELLFEMETWRF